jgi:hypothetical protein
VIWLSWRQQRTETLIAALVLAIVVAFVVPSGLHIASVYDSQSIGSCVAHPTAGCREALDAFAGRWDPLLNIVGWFNLVPAVIGALLATPLLLDFERGTHRLAWTQSVTRGRWLLVRLLVLALAAVLSASLLTASMTWWRAPLDAAGSRLQDGFDFEGIAPTAYTLFAAALVLAIGVVLRRTATAIGLAFVAFFVIRIGIEGWVRQRFEPAVHRTWAEGRGPDLRGAWILSQLRALRVLKGYPTDRSRIDSCLRASTKSVDNVCLARHHVVEYASVVYQPASRFWLFQGIETGIFGALTVALVLFSVWWIRKRIS